MAFAGPIAAAVLSVLSAPAAFAQVPGNISQSCTGDYRKLCAKCRARRRAHHRLHDEVSNACRAALRDEQGKRSAGKSG